MERELAGRLLVEARRAAGWSQVQMARASGEPQPVVSAYERGRRQPSVAALARLVRAAGLELTVVPRRRPDLEARAGRILPQVLDLADQLPHRRRAGRLGFPRLPAAP